MADVPERERAGLGRPAVIAIGFAIVALLTSIVAVIVVMRRHGEPVAVVAKAAAAPGTIERVIDATEVTKLKRDVVEKVVDDKGTIIGVRIKDEALRGTLGLESTDVITALGGRAIKREFDIYDAVLGITQLDASIVYVEILRENKEPALVRWKLEGELRTARRDPIRRPSVGGVFSRPSNPFTAPPDPLVDSIKRIDALHYELPRATLDQLLANPDQYARQARIVPSIRNGQPDGFKLYAIAPGSLWSAVGLVNGDTIRSVNGHDLSTPDQALELYTKLKSATELQILVGRRGGTVDTIAIAIK